jgi:hypothetical protein
VATVSTPVEEVAVEQISKRLMTWVSILGTRGQRVSALSAAPAYSSAARQQYQATTER